MKLQENHLVKAPVFNLDDQSIQVNRTQHKTSIVVTKTWEILAINITEIKQWSEHPKSKPCAQIITRTDNRIPTCNDFDLFWAHNKGVDFLPLNQAIQQVKIMILDQIHYQWLILLPRN
ncbi:hypothetical protein MMH89_03175 [Candidatus Comchoanobacter bicostacola]|uniref:Uncharacterized protein n=1 Tax=Candidatus Comchoanobacter bicostacola TaxID=2919598 RepID=A0ABY5DIM0_9GAMM|nr:hypothetical protein [Candidatus Comchoanobacter bicostacola]UTC24224.1 hypothetical protein MMH89_03175 [Candidatus Comchoanobacter bicostacola]